MTALFALLMALGLMAGPVEIRSLSVSAYTDADGAPPYQGLTASGAQTAPGTCACGSGFPFGTIFVVSGRRYVCQDRGPAITDGHLDLWMADRSDALAWGRQQLRVVVVRLGQSRD